MYTTRIYSRTSKSIGSLRVLIILTLSFLMASQALAKKDPPYLAKLPGDSILAGKSLAVRDTVYFNPALAPLILRTNSVSNVVSLRINEYALRILPDSFRAQVTVRLVYTNMNNLKDSVSSRVLTVDYNKLRPYKNKDIYMLQGAYYLEVKILSVVVNFATTAQVMPLLELENRMQADRQYIMNPIQNGVANTSTNAVKSLVLNNATVAVNGELGVSWAPNVTVESYDLEWTYVDSSALGSGAYHTGGQPDPLKIFRNNATRINTTGIAASIPLVYDAGGVLFMRVRGVQFDSTGERLTTKWSSDFPGTGGLGTYNMRGHERNLNWQVTTSFAEEAKRKTVVQYFDGSLRNRQTVTRDNTTATTVVAETMYDKQGRPVIQVLPAPTLDNMIRFTPGFNAFDANGNEFTKAIYDTATGINDYCSDTSKALSSAYGASKYYSPQNQQAGLGFNQYIPNAEGFVYTETRYTQDNSGRIAKQSGVGRTFRMGSGKETRYYYGTPEQKDLDALFGTEAGDASHYQKNMVRDANGQYSVSYVDMQGRTVATALAGIAPSGLKALNSAIPISVKEELLVPESNVVKGNSIVSTRSIVVPRNDTFTLSYSLGGSSLTIQDCQQRNICYDCLYDLTITITDECGNTSLPGGKPMVITRTNVDLFNIDTTCNVVTPLQVTFNVALQEGAYTITKELKISEEGMRYYRDSVFLLRNTCKTYTQWFNTTIAQIKSAATCDSVNTERSEQQSILADMEEDMVPVNGQYGAYPSTSVFSIFSKNKEGIYYYQTLTDYIDADGNAWPIDVTKLSPEEFIEQFDRAWLKTLVRLHPEYNRFLQYDSYQYSHDWAERFEKVETYAEAKQKGYLNPTGNGSRQPAARFGTIGKDPLYSLYGESRRAQQEVESKLFNYHKYNGNNYNLWNVSSVVAASAKGENNLEIYLQLANAFNESRFCAEDLDRAWKNFRDMYLVIRKDWIYNKTNTVPALGQVGEVLVFQNSSTVLTGLGLTGPPDSVSARVKRQIANESKATCEAYTSQWWVELTRGCTGWNSVDSAWIIPRLVAVCQQGVDTLHPAGASTVPANSTYRFRSFDQVVKFYVDSAGRGGVLCSGYLISRPYTYEKPGFVTNKPIVSKPDSCECGKINAYFTEYTSTQNTYSSFSKFLELRYKTQISQGSLDTLRAICGYNIAANLCTPSINNTVLPALFQCGGTVCISCNDVAQGLQDFKGVFSTYGPTYEDTSFTQSTVNLLFANFMNQRFGFGKLAVDYLRFIDTCSLSGSTRDTLKQDTILSWNNMFTAYKTWMNVAKEKNINRGWLHNSLWALGGGIYNPDWTLIDSLDIYKTPDIVSNGTIGYRVNGQGTYNDVHYGGLRNEVLFGYSVENEYAIEARFRNPPINWFVSMGSHWTRSIDPDPVYDEDFQMWIRNVDWQNCWYRLRGVQYDTNIPGIDWTGWHTMRYDVKPDSFRVFVDGVQIFAVPRAQGHYIYTVNKPAVGAGWSPEFELDWFKVYGKNNSLIISEDFNDSLSFTPPPYSSQYIPDCRTYFPEWVRNEWFGNVPNYPRYTFEQLDSLYFSQSGNHLNVCLDTSQIANGSYTDTLGAIDIFDVNKTIDGGAIISGETNESISNAVLVKIDERGRKIWETAASGPSWEHFSSTVQSKDGGFISAGITLSGVNDKMSLIGGLLVQKTNADGIVVWRRIITPVRKFNTPYDTVSSSYVNVAGAAGIRERSDRSIELSISGIDAGQSGLFTATLDSKGSLLRTNFLKIYDPEVIAGWAYNSYQVMLVNGEILEQRDSLVLFSGTSSFPTDQVQMPTWLVKVSKATGLPAKSRSIALPDGTKAIIDGIAGIKGGYAVSLRFHNGVSAILKTDSSLVPKKLFKLNFRGLSPYNQKITSRDNGNLGVVFNVTGDQTIWLELNNDSVVWARKSLQPLRATDVLQNDEWDGMLISGKVGTNNTSTIYRVSRNGSSACGDSTVQVTTSNMSFTPLLYNTAFIPYKDDSLVVYNLSTSNLAIPVKQQCGMLSANTDVGLRLCDTPVPDSLVTALAPEPACADTANIATMVTDQLFTASRDSVTGEFEKSYLAKCLDVMSRESLTLQHNILEYHYTLYYYDLAGNLVKTVPPEGVKPIRDTATLRQIQVKRAAGQRQVPTHFMATTYQYNTLNQVVKQQTPDAKISEFWYDRLGRLAVSQNAQQKLTNRYSYTMYDPLGRIVQVGQKVRTVAATSTITRNAASLWTWLTATYLLGTTTVVGEQVTSTVYDIQDPTMLLGMKIPTQRVTYSLRNRVSNTRYIDTLVSQTTGALANFTTSTTYSYDIHGNVDTLVQQFRTGMMATHGDNRFKVMTYQYDLISGKVNQVHYQPGQPDQYYHRYAYDAEKRITDVYTTTNKALIGSDVLEEHEAYYAYYKHGPLARTILGQQQVQGVDYAYTLQGWLKGVNSMALDTARDMGKDGGLTARDAYGFQLNYFTGDYLPINASRNPFPGHSAFIGTSNRPLYNGNISSMGVNIGKLNQPQLYNYEYDQLNRLVSMQAWRGFNSATNSWSAMAATTDHQERITYDGNGNIMSYFRNGNTSAGKPLDMDKLAYYYAVDGSGNKKNNQLLYVFDTVALATNYTEDIDRQSVGNYAYDSIGNLTRDNLEKISAITWNVYGKISQITKNTSTTVGDLQLIRYGYDASGNRIRKTAYYNQDATNYRAAHTWYVRDASGNVMATYTSAGVMPKNSTRDTTSKVPLYLSELHMYGSSRLGIWSRNVNMDVLPTGGGTVALLGSAGIDTFNRGNKFFELSNHLGNVLVTVSDRKFGQSPVNNLYTSFTADVVSATDYAPFGMTMPGRKYSSASSSYRYGFNGKENDNEVKGEGNQQDYGMRIYDPRLGKFLSVDPIANNFPDLTPYQFAGNTPIQAIDLDGGEPQGYREYWEARTDEYMTKWGFSVQDVYDYHTRQVWTVMRYPNTNEYYYYATKYESAQRLFVPKNTSLNKNGLEWTGSFKQFQTRSASELGAKSANAMLTSFAVGFSAPFAVAGAALTASFAIEQATIAAAQGILAYYRYGPAVGAAGKVVAEFLDETGTVSGSGKIRNVIDESRVKHIFRNEVGHFIEDTKEARQAIENVANDASNLLGADKYGSGWYAWINEKGQQLWAQVRKGQIVNGGVNEVPREFSTEAGLAAKEVPKK